MRNEVAPKNHLFEASEICSAWDEEAEKWWFSVLDVIAVLTESFDATVYWHKLKQRLKAEGNETVTTCHGLKMRATDMTSITKQRKIKIPRDKLSPSIKQGA